MTRKLALIVLLSAVALSAQGCIAMAVGTVAGTAIGVTGAVIGAAAKGTVAVGKAIIPGDSRTDKAR
jgi:hypothetical protein